MPVLWAEPLPYQHLKGTCPGTTADPLSCVWVHMLAARCMLRPRQDAAAHLGSTVKDLDMGLECLPAVQADGLSHKPCGWKGCTPPLPVPVAV